MGACCTASQSQGTATAKSSIVSDEKPYQYECTNDNNYKKCPSLLRLGEALQFYASLNLTNNPQDIDTFTNYITTKQTNLLNDYIHFIQHHQHQIEEI